MSTVSTLLLLGLDRQELFAAVGTAAALVSMLCIVVVVGLALVPAASRNWAEQFGVEDVGGGVDPAEVIDGREEPIPPRGSAVDSGGVEYDDADVPAADEPAVESTGSTEPPAPSDVAGSESA